MARAGPLQGSPDCSREASAARGEGRTIMVLSPEIAYDGVAPFPGTGRTPCTAVGRARAGVAACPAVVRRELAQHAPLRPLLRPDLSRSVPGRARCGRGLAKRQCSVMAALDRAAHPHQTEANPETVSRAMMMTAARLTTPKIAT